MGGRHGAAFVAGKGSQSNLVRYLTGEMKPQMPPGKPLTLEALGLIRRWIDEGARIDNMQMTALPTPSPGDAMPRAVRPGPAPGGRPTSTLLPTAVVQVAPVTALAMSPSGALLAAGGYRRVRLLDPATGAVIHTLDGPAEQVYCLAWTADGGTLVAGGGVPGVSGEVCVWKRGGESGWGAPRRLTGHADAVVALACRAGSDQLATGSPDKSVRIWALDSGRLLRELRDHVDGVTAVAYSPDGRWLATGAVDRTVRLYEADGKRAVTLAHGDAVTALLFTAGSDTLVTASADRQARVWPVRAGSIENPVRSQGEGEVILSLARSADGKAIAWGAANRRVRVWSADLGGQRREFADARDWVYAVALNADATLVYAGCGDGGVRIWKISDGTLLAETRLAADPEPRR